MTSSQWTPEDRALLLAWRRHQGERHERCGHRIDRAMHPKNGAAVYDVVAGVCHACTAADKAVNPEAPPHKVVLSVADSRDYDVNPLPPFDLDDLDADDAD